MGSSTLFPAEDKLREKADYHGWKMSIDLTLEDQRVLDHVRGNIVEPPSNASAADWNKWKNGEVKTKKIIRDSIDKHLVAYISELDTSKEIYDRLGNGTHDSWRITIRMVRVQDYSSEQSCNSWFQGING